jgi:hypothetical protein
MIYRPDLDFMSTPKKKEIRPTHFQIMSVPDRGKVVIDVFNSWTIIELFGG